MVSKAPNSRRNLDMAIERVFGKDQDPLRVRTLIANTIIGQLLPSGAVKGGSSLKLRYGNNATRFTRDLDAVRAGELDDFVDSLSAALAEGWNGFTGKIIRKEPAKPKNVPGEYVMQPFEVKLSYNMRAWLTVQLEIGHDEIGDTTNPDYFISPDVISIFEILGLPAPKPIPLMPIPYQIAQKLHGLSDPQSVRAHDLIDLQVICQNEDIDYTMVQATCSRLFAYRQSQAWPPVVVKRDVWDALYIAQSGDLDVMQTVDEAVVWVNRLIGVIEDARR